MDFITKTDLYIVIDEKTLNVLTTDDTLTEEAILDAAEGRAIDEMSGYLNTRYNIVDVFDAAKTRNGLVVMYLCDIVLYHLHSRKSPDNIPELRKDRYNSSVDWLEKTADGFTNPPLPAKEESEQIPLRKGNSSPKQNFYY